MDTVDIAACRAHLEARWQHEQQVREVRRQEALSATVAAAQAVLPQFPQVQRAYAFGSVVRPGAMRAVSDVDIAVEGTLSAEDYFALWRELEHMMPDWAVDLIELGRDVAFAANVRRHGLVIYEYTQ